MDFKRNEEATIGWANQYKALGEKAFEEKSTTKAYIKNFKETDIKEF